MKYIQYKELNIRKLKNNVLLSVSSKYFTHYWKNQKGDVYLFCYEFGFLEKYENEKSK
jgi:hypothetical protein